MKKFLFLMFTCATATTVSYAGDRLRMLEEAGNPLKSKNLTKKEKSSAKETFGKLSPAISEYYRAETLDSVVKRH
ncbi:MAG: hypothetical protein ACRCYP_01210 [Alphaproteobacteria bacterium]